MSKKLLILERSGETLVHKGSDDDYITLEGTFTQFDIKNKNGRIYEEKEFLPHLKELQEKVKKGKLLGELDHPTKFDISLQNVSHVIEELEYDPSKKQVVGRIKLLNTDKGKQAKALVEAGVPLHISSRAAGNVGNDGKVKIQKLFTYDLVADPGFAAAELTRVNESFGFIDDEDLFIYELTEAEAASEANLIETPINTKNTQDTMSNPNFVSIEDFNRYSEYVKQQFESLKNGQESSEKLDKVVEYTNHLAENMNKLFGYTNYLAENLDKNISHSDYIVESMNSIKEYSNYLAENVNKGISYSEYVAEQTNQLVDYTKYVAEKVDQGLSYSEYLAENQDKMIQFSNYLAEHQNNGIAYSKYLAERMDQGISYSEYLAENQNNMIKYSEYIKENVENLGKYANYLAENLNTVNEKTAEQVSKVEAPVTVTDAVSEKTQVQSIEESTIAAVAKVDALLESVKTKKEEAKDEKHFMRFLDTTKRNEFESLNESTQTQIVEAFATNRYMSVQDANKIWNSCFTPAAPAKLDYVSNMPERYKAVYESLSASQKDSISKQSKLFGSLETQYQIDNFWQTRDLRPRKVEIQKINENETPAQVIETSPAGVPLQVVNDVRDALKARFKNI
jgi:hypothetical protein